MPDAPLAPGPLPRTVRTPSGEMRRVPDGWELLPPGDASLTRRVKAAGETWAVAEKKGRKLFSRGVWAPAGHIRAAEAALAAERADPAHAKRLAAGAARREKAQAEYVEDFAGAVRQFLAFHPNHADLADRMAVAIAAHATPVGSGTVARTKRIPVEERAGAATIAWLRHATTAYDRMLIARVKGKRREVRRELARASVALLGKYRRGEAAGADCPLERGLSGAKPVAPAVRT